MHDFGMVLAFLFTEVGIVFRLVFNVATTPVLFIRLHGILGLFRLTRTAGLREPDER